MPLSIEPYADQAIMVGRPQVDGQAARVEHSMCFVKGMHHALVSDSSQRPGEDDAIERR